MCETPMGKDVGGPPYYSIISSPLIVEHGYQWLPLDRSGYTHHSTNEMARKIYKKRSSGGRYAHEQTVFQATVLAGTVPLTSSEHLVVRPLDVQGKRTVSGLKIKLVAQGSENLRQGQLAPAVFGHTVQYVPAGQQHA